MSGHEQLIRRLDDLGASAVHGTTAPPFDLQAFGHGERGGPRRRWLAGVAAAATAAAVVGVAVWSPWETHSNQVDTVDTVTTTAPSGDAFPMLMPDRWPVGSSGDVTTRDPLDPGAQREWEIAQHLLVRDGVAAAHAAVSDFAVGDGTPDTGYTATAATVGGREAQWITGPDMTSLSVALEPGRSLSVGSATASAEDLEALALAYDAERLDFDAPRLPSGWAVTADPAGVIDFQDGIPPASWAVAQRPSATSGIPTFVAATRVPDARSTLELFVGLAGERAEMVEVGGRPAATITGVGPHPGRALVVWVHDDATIAAASAGGPDAADAVDMAASVGPVEPGTWTSYIEEPESPARVIDGFELSGDEQIVDSGERFGHRWMVTTGAGPTGGSMTMLYLIDPDGQQHASGWGGTGNMVGTGGGIAGAYRYFHAEIPSEVTDPAIVLHGQRRDVVEVDKGGDTRMIFTIVEARSTPRVEPGDAYVTGTLADGGNYRDPPAPPGT